MLETKLHCLSFYFSVYFLYFDDSKIFRLALIVVCSVVIVSAIESFVD